MKGSAVSFQRHIALRSSIRVGRISKAKRYAVGGHRILHGSCGKVEHIGVKSGEIRCKCREHIRRRRSHSAAQRAAEGQRLIVPNDRNRRNRLVRNARHRRNRAAGTCCFCKCRSDRSLCGGGRRQHDIVGICHVVIVTVITCRGGQRSRADICAGNAN